MFAMTVAFAVLLCIHFLLRRSVVAGLGTSLGAAAGLLVGVGRIERQHETINFNGVFVALPHLFWEGFGITIAIVALVLAVFLWRLVERVESEARAADRPNRRRRSVISHVRSPQPDSDGVELRRTGQQHVSAQ